MLNVPCARQFMYACVNTTNSLNSRSSINQLRQTKQPSDFGTQLCSMQQYHLVSHMECCFKNRISNVGCTMRLQSCRERGGQPQLLPQTLIALPPHPPHPPIPSHPDSTAMLHTEVAPHTTAIPQVRIPSSSPRPCPPPLWGAARAAPPPPGARASTRSQAPPAWAPPPPAHVAPCGRGTARH